MTTISGLEVLLNDSTLQSKIEGKIGLLCHSASVDSKYNNSIILLQRLFKERLIKVFGPQHGFVSDVQDNMIETDHYQHPYFKLPIYSLYSETRIPTDSMLENIDTMIVDLQDVGTRVYTYISTLGLLMKKCSKLGIKVIVLDRPNPVNGNIIEGNVLEKEYHSFVGHYEIPMRHAMTMGEIGHFCNKFQLDNSCNYDVIKMKNWKRDFFYEDTNLPWVNPSPNLPTINSAYTFVGTVLFEGTNISEGRGTTRSLELVGHPKIESFSFLDHLNKSDSFNNLSGFILRPTNFMPTFQKHANIACGGVHIHVTNPKQYESWKVGQALCLELYNYLQDDFSWNDAPYEYENDKLSIDLINGSSKIREFIENKGTLFDICNFAESNLASFKSKRKECLIY